MTALENIHFEEAIMSQKDLTSLSIQEHVKEANEVYLAIRPAFVGLGWVFKKIFPKISLAINKLVTVLDGLFGAIAITNF